MFIFNFKSDEQRKAIAFEAVANLHGLDGIDHHTLQVIYQAEKPKYGYSKRHVIPIMEGSITSKDLVKHRLAQHLTDSQLFFTQRGEEVKTDLTVELGRVNGIVRVNPPLPPAERLVTEGGGLQELVRGLRTSWESRPRFTRFTIMALKYRLRKWWESTAPVHELVSQRLLDSLKGVIWTENHEREVKELWLQSELLAFWLCPQGVDAGIELHDTFLANVDQRVGESRRKIVYQVAGEPFTKQPPETATPTMEELIESPVIRLPYSQKKMNHHREFLEINEITNTNMNNIKRKMEPVYHKTFYKPSYNKHRYPSLRETIEAAEEHDRRNKALKIHLHIFGEPASGKTQPASEEEWEEMADELKDFFMVDDLDSISI